MKTSEEIAQHLRLAWDADGHLYRSNKSELARALTRMAAGRLCRPQTLNTWFTTGRMDKFWLPVVRAALPSFTYGRDLPEHPFIHGGNLGKTSPPNEKVTWEVLVQRFDELPSVFDLQVTDDILSPEVQPGDTLTFDRREPGYAGAFVIVRSRSTGALMLRQYREVEPDVFRAVGGPRSGLEPLDGSAVEVVATYIHHGRPSPKRRQTRVEAA